MRDNEKAIELEELITKARDTAIENGIGTLNLNQALAILDSLLRAKPPAGEWTKEVRKILGNPKVIPALLRTITDFLYEACDRLDAEIAKNKEYAEIVHTLKETIFKVVAKSRQLRAENKQLIKCENDLRKIHEEQYAAVKKAGYCFQYLKGELFLAKLSLKDAK